MIAKLLSIFSTFLYVGSFSFGGGLATIPLIQKAVVNHHGWLTQSQFSDVFTISNMTPGPIAINAATFVGMKLAGPLGALIATIGILVTQIILCTIFAKLLFSHKKSRVLSGALFGLAPGVVGLIAAVTLTMFFTNLFPQNVEGDPTAMISVLSHHVDLMACVPFGIGLMLLIKKVDMSKVLLIGAAVGLLIEVIFH